MEQRSNGTRGSNESLDTTGKQKSFRRLLVRFAEKTSLQGVGYINSARLICARIIWVLLLLGAIGGMVFHLYYLCDQFFAWPKLTKITLGFNNLPMPDITICNVNAVRRSKLNDTNNKFQQFIQMVDSVIAPNGKRRRRRKRFTAGLNDVNVTGFQPEITIPADSGKPPKNRINQISETFRNLYMDLNRNTRVKAGHELRDMLVSCSFNGRDCYHNWRYLGLACFRGHITAPPSVSLSYDHGNMLDPDTATCMDKINFNMYQTAEYGNCYTLPSDSFTASTAGPSYGLNLILYMQNEEYINGITQGYGVRVTIHQADTFPFPADDGIFVSSSFETSIGLKLVDITRLPKPHGDCNDGTSFSTTYNRTYSRQACQNVCEQNYIISTCICFSEQFAELFLIANKDQYHPCRSVDEKTCERTVMQSFVDKDITCTCLDPCSEQDYEKTTSSRQWPSEDYAVALEQSVCENQGLAKECAQLRQLDKRQLSANFLKVGIYYESLNYELVEETPEIEVAQFASDVGGAIGLWIGLSILSMFELAQLFVECCDYALHRCCKREAYRDRKQAARQRRYMESNTQGMANYPPRNVDPGRDPKYEDYNDRITPYGFDARDEMSERERDGPYRQSEVSRESRGSPVYVYKGSRK